MTTPRSMYAASADTMPAVVYPPLECGLPSLAPTQTPSDEKSRTGPRRRTSRSPPTLCSRHQCAPSAAASSCCRSSLCLAAEIFLSALPVILKVSIIKTNKISVIKTKNL